MISEFTKKYHSSELNNQYKNRYIIDDYQIDTNDLNKYNMTYIVLDGDGNVFLAKQKNKKPIIYSKNKK